MKRRIGLVYVFLPAVLTVYCSSAGPTANGGSGTETTTGIYATAIYPNGAPAAKATVRLRRGEYFTQLPSLRKGAAIIGADALTDDSGRFEINCIEPGSYRIEVNDGHAAALIACSLDVRDTVDLGLDTLRPFATIAGMIDTAGRAGQQAYVQVEGLERIAAVDDSGRFVLSDLPAGRFTVRTVTAHDTAIATASGITVGPGDSTDITVPSGWRFSKRLHLNTTAPGAGVSEDVMNFPLLVRLTGADFDFTQARDSGQDLRFAKSDGSPLPYEIERWDAAAQSAAVWVRIDTVRGNDATQSFTMRWGNSNAASLSKGNAVFDTSQGFIGVWHLGNPLQTNRPNSAQAAFEARPAGYSQDAVAPGIAGACDSLGQNAHDTLGAINMTRTTVSVWVNMNRREPWARIVQKPSMQAYHAWGLVLDSSAQRVTANLSVNGGMDVNILSGTTLALDAWTHLCMSYDGNNLVLYVNGREDCRFSQPGIIDASNELAYIAWHDAAPGYQKFYGKVDEVRIESAPRSAAWVKLSYENQKVGSTVVVMP